MTTHLGACPDAVSSLAVEAVTGEELGAMLSAVIGPWVAHDGYHLIGPDPVSGASPRSPWP